MHLSVLIYPKSPSAVKFTNLIFGIHLIFNLSEANLMNIIALVSPQEITVFDLK